MQKIDVSIVIVSYNTKDLLVKCITSIFEFCKDVNFEIIVVDNNSSDGSVGTILKSFPKAIVVKNKKNCFFSKANNQGINRSKGKYILFFAPDAYFSNKSSLKNMVRYMENNTKIGACEGLEIYNDKKIVPNGSLHVRPLLDFYELSFVGKRLKNKKIIDKFRITSKKRTETFSIQVGCDAFLLARADVLRKINGFDEKLLLYYTENDLCKRIEDQGYRIMHYGKAKVFHAISVSTNTLKWKKLDIYYSDLLQYYMKHGFFISGFLLFLLLKVEQNVLRVMRPHMFDVK